MLHHNNISNNINNNITNNINNNISNNITITSLTTALQQHYNSTKTVLFKGSQFFEKSSVAPGGPAQCGDVGQFHTDEDRSPFKFSKLMY